MSRGDSRKARRRPSTHGRASAKDEKPGKRWGKLTSLPFLALTTALTVLVTWLVTQALTGVERERELANPVTLTVESNPANVAAFSDLSIEVALPATAQTAPDPGSGCGQFHPKLLGMGAADAGTTRVQVVTQGSTSEAVLISSMRAVVTKREEPLTGPLAVCPSAGAAQIRPVSIDLDSQSPVAEPQSGAAEFGFTVAQGETETFLVSATTEECFCEWHLEVALVVAGERQIQTIFNAGRPFRTTASSALTPRLEWDYEGIWYADGGQVRPGQDLAVLDK
jgi:hypothetical protein